MNVFKFRKHILISQGHMLLSFLPVQLRYAHDSTYDGENNLKRLSKWKKINHWITQMMTPLAEKVLHGIQTSTVDKERGSIDVTFGY